MTKLHGRRKPASSYEKSIAEHRKKKAAAKLRLAKAQEKEIKRFIKIAQATGLFNYEYTDTEISEVFDELVGKKSRPAENQPYSRSNRNSTGSN